MFGHHVCGVSIVWTAFNPQEDFSILDELVMMNTSPSTLYILL
uniref:Uncharacterized protein n=1 Tax=Anguilla anguilla TaxID=7936 RepID=A0A0E9UJI3_ANGAN